MKKVFIAVAAIAIMGLNSCSECVDCSSVAAYGNVKVCKKDYEAAAGSSGVSWSTYKAALQAAGCK